RQRCRSTVRRAVPQPGGTRCGRPQGLRVRPRLCTCGGARGSGIGGLAMTVVVTGAGGNLGRACVDLFAQSGLRVAAVDLVKPLDGQELSNVQWFAADVTSPVDVAHVHDEIVAWLHSVSVLV